MLFLNITEFWNKKTKSNVDNFRVLTRIFIFEELFYNINYKFLKHMLCNKSHLI